MFAYTSAYGKLWPVLATRTCVLTPFDESDTEDLLAFFRDPQVRKYLWDDLEIDRATVVSVVQASLSEFAAGRCGMFCLRLAETAQRVQPTIIGFCGLRPADYAPGAAELLYGLLPEYWGRGFATDAAEVVLRHAATATGLRRFVAATDAPNRSSALVLERLGMHFERKGNLHGLATLFYSLPVELFQSRYGAQVN